MIGLFPLYGSVHCNEQLFPLTVRFDIEGESGGPITERGEKMLKVKSCKMPLSGILRIPKEFKFENF